MSWFGREEKTTEFMLCELVGALQATNRELLAQNRDLHNRLAVRFPGEFHQYLQAEQLESARESTEVRTTAAKPREPEPPMPQQIGLDGRGDIISENVNAAIAARKGV